MSKLDLKKTLGFSVIIEDGIVVESELQYSNSASFEIKDMKDQLLNSEITCPEVFYTKYYNFDKDGIYKSKNIKVNLITIQSNLAGIEYVKTRGVRTTSYPKILEVVSGAGIIILQNFEKKFEGDIIISNLKKDTKVIIPADYAYSITNTRSSMLVVSEISFSKSDEIDELDDMNGMAYYVIRKNAKQETVRNPGYKMVSDPRKVKWDEVLMKLGITLKTPIIKQILRKYEKFEWLFKEDSVSL